MVVNVLEIVFRVLVIPVLLNALNISIKCLFTQINTPLGVSQQGIKYFYSVNISS
jgi:hypothetical protein